MIARLITRLPSRLARAACLLTIGHVYHLKVEDRSLFLRCELCGHDSAGVHLPDPRRGRQLAGDRFRFESAARRVSA